jgi:SAM-dependent methyltransferase
MIAPYYVNTLRRLLGQGRLRRDMRVLLVCGTQLDRDVFHALGFDDVLITNLNDQHGESELAPFRWGREDVESLSFPDNSFEVVVVRHGLHHCRQPHKALCEMYRVAQTGVLLFEPCVNPLVKLGQKFRVGQTYEVHAVADNGLVQGGVNNTAIPNLVHRWTACEVMQTLRAFAPEYDFSTWVDYHMEIHWNDLRSKRNKLPLFLAAGAWPLLWLITRIYPKLANTMAVYVEKPGQLQPWLRQDGDGVIKPDEEWFARYITRRA